MSRIGRRGTIAGALAAALIWATGDALADPAKKETQSILFDQASDELTSSALIKLLNEKLAGAYQDLELVITSCSGGEFTTRAKGLQGAWSVSTAAKTGKCNGTTYGNPDPKVGGKDGLKLGDNFFDGWDPQWVKSLLADGSKATNKSLFDYATANMGYVGQGPAYASSGAAADNMTIHGGASSNHAIVFASGGYVRVNDAFVDALNKAGYAPAAANNTLTYLSSEKDKKADQATFGNLNTALDMLRKQLDAKPGEEKALLILNTHGGWGEKTVAYQNGKFGQAGGGAVVTAAADTQQIYVDDPTLLHYLQQQLPKTGGGYWSDDPSLQRTGPAVLSFSTLSELFVGGASVAITADGDPIGDVVMGNSGGADYQIPIPDAVLGSIMGAILATDSLTIGFGLQDSADMFRLATVEDYNSPGYGNLDYGITIGANVSPALVPEPPSVCLLGIAICLGMLGRNRIGARRAGAGPAAPRQAFDAVTLPHLWPTCST